MIAAAGSIGIEILDQLPDTEAILVPIGGGGLIAGIAAFVKHVKPNVLIYVMSFFILNTSLFSSNSTTIISCLTSLINLLIEKY